MKLIVWIGGMCVTTLTSVLILTYGWGLTPVNMPWVVWGNLFNIFAIIATTFIVAGLKD